MKYKLLIVKKGRSNRGTEMITTMGISEIPKLDGRLSHTSFDFKTLGRLTKSKVLFLEVKLPLYLGIDFLIIITLGSLNNLVSMISPEALNTIGYRKTVNSDH